MHVLIAHAPDFSTVSLVNSNGHTIDTITYTRKIHRYESESSYKTIATELRTYGDQEAMDTFRYLRSRTRRITPCTH